MYVGDGHVYAVKIVVYVAVRMFVLVQIFPAYCLPRVQVYMRECYTMPMGCLSLCAETTKSSGAQ